MTRRLQMGVRRRIGSAKAASGIFLLEKAFLLGDTGRMMGEGIERPPAGVLECLPIETYLCAPLPMYPKIDSSAAAGDAKIPCR